MTRCQHCWNELGWDVHDDPLPEGETVFVHKCNVPTELGVENRYYCSAECLSRAVDGQRVSPGTEATVQ